MRNCDDKERREGSHNLEMMACVTGGVKFAITKYYWDRSWSLKLVFK